ncbi:uncharacterized protein LOC133321834 [Musca vetustissima]|uniref:uncharacterized protein LOC133321834 n=1 Tax=Musca vetustissima TaxID=27455 RepID=UPI002AB61572|nr:uncharacterized protein LOC133321834 [Musca vetustissima]
MQFYVTEPREHQPETQQKEDSPHALFSKYSPEDGEKILKSLNNYNLKELLSYDITKGRANKLLAWRMRNGLLSNLSDIFLVEGFGPKVADKFYQSLLQDPTTTEDAGELGKTNRARTAPFITPTITPEQQMQIKSCVSVRVGVNSVTWSRLQLPPADSNEPCQLTHWHHHEISEKKLHLHELIQRCLYVNHMIPDADCYLFENPQMAQASNNPGSVEQQNINIQKAQVTAVMGYALASRHNAHQETNTNNEEEGEVESNTSPKSALLFYVRRFLTARLFNHLVGTERISSEDTIINMMRTYYNINDLVIDEEAELKPQVAAAHAATGSADETSNNNTSIRGNVQFPMELRHMFSKSLRYHREFLGQALLLNLAFVRLVLLQDPESIAKVSRGNKTKNVVSI